MSIDWDDYEPYVPLHWGPQRELSRPQARESFEHLMAARPERLDQLRRLLSANGVQLGPHDDAIQALDDWFRAHVEPSPNDPDRLRNLWYAVVNDIGLFLGDVMIARSPGLRWEMFTKGKRDIAYQRHVIMGFTKVANPKYNIDVDRVVATHGYRVVGGEAVDPDEFVAMIKAAAADA